jgi:hypothetical protein
MEQKTNIEMQGVMPVGSGVWLGHRGPRLKCDEKSLNHFYGGYKKHSIGIERDHKGAPWGFRVITESGERAADGVMDGDATMREVILHALKGAMLWPNIRS